MVVVTLLTNCVVKDEALRNLMMSWYYAGYYTGLYEGQQQQSTNTTISNTKEGANGANEQAELASSGHIV